MEMGADSQPDGLNRGDATRGADESPVISTPAGKSVGTVPVASAVGVEDQATITRIRGEHSDLRDQRLSGTVRDVASQKRDPRTEAQRDRDRLLYSAQFRRLANVTQVITPPGYAPTMHNRLTHSLKVAQVARSIANLLTEDAANTVLLHKLGGLDPDACEAASLAHDIGHPPFGHVGEAVLDRLARKELGLRDGFEGNAQSLRILTTGTLRNLDQQGLDLSCATLAGIAKYPWTRGTPPCQTEDRQIPGQQAPAQLRCPNGIGCGRDCSRKRTWTKFNFYAEQEDLIGRVREFAGVEPGIQTLEASVMDLADDISYAVHDLEDFLLSGIIDHNRVLESLDNFEKCDVRGGHSERDTLEALAISLRIKYGQRFNDDDFAESVGYITEQLTSLFELLYRSTKVKHSEKIARVAQFAASEIGEYVNPEGIELSEKILWDYGPHISLNSRLWHRVQIFKWITRTFIIGEADIALLQRGQKHIMEKLVLELHRWAADGEDQERLPRPLLEQIEVAREQGDGRASIGYAAGEQAPRGDVNRAIIDYICTLSDGQCVSLYEKLSGARVHSGGIKESF